MSKKEETIISAEKDDSNSCMVVITENGQSLVSCAECRIGEVECNFAKKKWGIDPCLYKRGVRLGRNMEPDPRDVMNMIQNNLAQYNNMVTQSNFMIKPEMQIALKILKAERQELDRVKDTLYGKYLNKQDANTGEGQAR